MPSPLDAVPAIRRIETDRDDAFAFDIAGHVTAADVENLYGLLEGAYALHEHIDLLVKLTDFDGIDWGEVARDTRKDGRRHAINHVRRCAAVGGPDWTGYVSGFFSSPVPGEIRYFAEDQEKEAWEWIGARPQPEA